MTKCDGGKGEEGRGREDKGYASRAASKSFESRNEGKTKTRLGKEATGRKAEG